MYLIDYVQQTPDTAGKSNWSRRCVKKGAQDGNDSLSIPSMIMMILMVLLVSIENARVYLGVSVQNHKQWLAEAKECLNRSDKIATSGDKCNVFSRIPGNI